MNIRQLEIFWEIMRTGSVTGAARSLSISQPAVSRILRHTEDQLGMKLFERRSGRVHPTEEAQHLFVIAETIFDNIAKVRQAAVDFRDGQTGRIQVASTPNLSAVLLPLPVGAFLRDRPRVELSVKVLTTSQVVSRVALHQADIGLVYGPVKDPSVKAEELFAMKLVCLVRRDSPLADLKIVTPQDLSAERIISFHRTTPCGGVVRQVLQTALGDKTVDFECDHSIVALSLVQGHAGVALVPPLLHLSDALGDVVARPFLPEIVIRPMVLYRGMPPLSRLTTALLEELRRFGRAQQDKI